MSRGEADQEAPGPSRDESTAEIESRNQEDVFTPESALPFQLPEILYGLERYVFEEASRLAGGDDSRFERMARLVVADLEHRVRGYYALGRIATNKNSLPARLVGATD